MIHDALIAPFTEFEFMRRALAAAIALSLGGAPIGVFLMLRRMSLVGDAMAHAILPGAAVGFVNMMAAVTILVGTPLLGRVGREHRLQLMSATPLASGVVRVVYRVC